MTFLKYIGVSLVVIHLFSCKKFLEETSPSIIIPTEVSHYEELLYGEGYPTATDGYSRYTELLTDDVQWNHIPSPNALYLPLRAYSTKAGWGLYLYTDDPESASVNGVDNYWGSVYKAIGVCNVVLDGLDKTTDNEALKKHVKGQAYALRAMHYLSLMNIYGMPYIKNTDSEWGVPVKTTAHAEDRLYRRNTVHEVYQLMRSDIDSAVKLCDPAKKLKIYEMSWYAAMVLATRIHLYMEEYDEVIRLAETYLVRKSELPTPASALTAGNFTGFTASWSGVAVNPEVVFNYGISVATYNGVYQASAGYDYFTISTDLRNLYAKSLKTGESDQRMTSPAGVVASWFFGVASSQYVPRKIYNFNTKKSVLRTGELLLNLAEAYAVKKDIAKALSQLNYLRASRIKSYTSLTAASFTDETIVDFTREERRRELCFEDFRLPDLKRYGMPAQVHTIQDFTGKYKVNLAEGDFGYVLQVPLKELALNAEIKRIPRPVRMVEPN
jgi:hypothetical protein